MDGGLTLRPAVAEDAAVIARVFSASLRSLSFLPEIHTVEDDRLFISDKVLKAYAVTVALLGDRIVSFLARQGEEILLLYTDPDFIGRGAGTALLEAEKEKGFPVLELWCFQANGRARRFYEARGFRAIKFTDGAGNDEKMPDIRYRWEGPGGGV